jgi:hypothetical protein
MLNHQVTRPLRRCPGNTGGMCLLALCLYATSAPSGADVFTPLTEGERDRMAAMRAAALRGDRTQGSAILEALGSKHETVLATSLQACSQLGLSEAIPAVEAIATRPVPNFIKQRARAALARIKAEMDARSLSTSAQQSEAKVNRILTELNVTPDQANSRVAAHVNAKGAGDVWPIELYALQEIAKTAYYGPYSDFKAVPAFQQLDFNLDPAASLLIQLAPMNRDQRVSWLVNELANKRSLTGDDRCVLQLLIDEGAVASQAVASKLQNMAITPEKYSSIGFCALFRVLRGIGDKDQAPVIARFLKGFGPSIAYYADQVYSDVSRGLRSQYASGF